MFVPVKTARNKDDHIVSYYIMSSVLNIQLPQRVVVLQNIVLTLHVARYSTM